MNRRNFLKVMIGTIGVAFVSPKVLFAEATKPIPLVALWKVVCDEDINRIDPHMLANDISKILDTFMYELNDSQTRKKATELLRLYLEPLKERGALVDYQIKDNNFLNSLEESYLNAMRIDVFIKDLSDEEFYQIKFIVGSTPKSMIGVPHE